jgi:hypothetical protein
MYLEWKEKLYKEQFLLCSKTEIYFRKNQINDIENIKTSFINIFLKEKFNFAL